MYLLLAYLDTAQGHLYGINYYFCYWLSGCESNLPEFGSSDAFGADASGSLNQAPVEKCCTKSLPMP
jgi:hypothetical protein